MGASRLHLVPTPCLHTLSPHLVPTHCLHTLSLYASSQHFVPTLCRKRQDNWRVDFRFRPRPRSRYYRYYRYYRRTEGQASACPRIRGRADARPSRGCGLGVFCGALRAAGRDGVAPPVLARFCGNCPKCGAGLANVTAGDGGLQRSGFSVHICCRLYRTAPPAASAQAHGTAAEM